MIKKIMCLLLAVVSCFVLSVSAFAAVPTDEASSSTGNEFLDSYFADWEEAGEQAVALRDACKVGFRQVLPRIPETVAFQYLHGY